MAKPEIQPEQSESMEEILQSIKRIMDDSTVGDQPAPAAAAEEADVFDLTNVVQEGEPVPAIAEPSAAIDDFAAPDVFTPPAAEVPAAPVLKTFVGEIQDGLMSEQSVSAAASEFKKIVDSTQKDYSIPTIPSPTLRNGNTVEDLVVEALRPMLKDWLDQHLPVIVQRIVEKEVKRIVTLHKD